MAIELNHTIVWCSDQQKSATFLTELFGLPEPTRFGPFLVVTLANGVSLDYYTLETRIARQHYAFLITEAEFDAIFARIEERGMTYWADPGRTEAGETYRHNGGRGLYFDDPDGHLLEIMTRPYGAWED